MLRRRIHKYTILSIEISRLKIFIFLASDKIVPEWAQPFLTFPNRSINALLTSYIGVKGCQARVKMAHRARNVEGEGLVVTRGDSVQLLTLRSVDDVVECSRA